jgi:hypothetical protein
MCRASRQNRASECRESHEFIPLLSTGSELGRRPEHLKGETPTIRSDARPFCGIFRSERPKGHVGLVGDSENALGLPVVLDPSLTVPARQELKASGRSR